MYVENRTLTVHMDRDEFLPSKALWLISLDCFVSAVKCRFTVIYFIAQIIVLFVL